MWIEETKIGEIVDDNNNIIAEFIIKPYKSTKKEKEIKEAFEKEPLKTILENIETDLKEKGIIHYGQ